MRRNWGRTALCALSALALVPTPVAQAEPVAAAAQESSNVAPAERDELLGKGWQSSSDRLWTTTGDSDGLRLLVAEAKTGYTWRTVATLSQPGVETDRWIGNACVTGSGQRAVVVYAPRTFTNSDELAARGGFTAVVDLNSGAVTKLPIRTSLAYFNPGCGAAETVALTQEGDVDLGRTGVTVLDAASGRLGKRTELATQVTSATPVDGGFVVADAIGVLRVGGDGAKRRLVQETGGVPRELRADADGGVVYLDRDGDHDRVQRVAATASTAQKPSTLATAPPGQVALARGAHGKVFITGTPSSVKSLPGAVSRLDVPAQAEVSTTGEAAVTDVKTALPSLFERKKASDPVRIESKSLRSGKKLGFVVDPATALTPRWDETVDPNRVCSVQRNDPGLQVYQPKPKQVEWAADMAISGHLDVSRPRNWNNNGVNAYRPQDLFPRVGLTGGGQVPAQVLLGVLGQESNLWQADRRKLPGEFGNPLVGNYYGTDIYNADPNDDWVIRWDKADCGYGVTQMTDGMRLPGKPKPDKPNDQPMAFNQQRAIGTDYAANVAAGLRLLETKWNEMQARGMRLNNNNPARIENWFFAVWAYNSGFHAQGESGTNGAWGLGWLNNPANPRYPLIRQRFGRDPHDFAKPQQWPYPEKVLGFAANPPSGYEAPGVEVPFFRAAWWGGANPTANRDASVPPLNQFCTTSNDCRWGQAIKPNAPEVADEPAGPCAHVNAAGQTDLKCWVHESSSWRLDCDTDCGHEFVRYDWDKAETRAEPANGTSYPPNCANTGLDTGAGIADDVPTATKPVSVLSCPIKANMPGASFSLDFGGRNGDDASGRIDLHQASGGYGAHFWYGHTRPDTAEGRALAINATWKFGRIDGLATIKAHIPDHLATAVVDYYVDTAEGVKKVTVDQGKGDGTGFNRWVTLGSFHFFNEPTVRLGTIREGADGTKQVAFDAVAIEPFRGLETAGSRVPVNVAQINNDFCMVLKDNNPKDDAALEARPCSTWMTDYWTLLKIGDTPPNGNEPTAVVQIMDSVTEKCLEPITPRQPGSGVHEVTCDKNNKAQWWLVNSVDRTASNSVEVLENYDSTLSMRLSVPEVPPGSAALPITLWKRLPEEDPSGKTFYWRFL